MQIQIEISPEDLAKVIVDVNYNQPESKEFLQYLVHTVKKLITAKKEELEEMDFVAADVVEKVNKEG